MPYGIYLSAEGAQVQSRRLEVLANNLANADTAGFKRQLAIAQARYAEDTQRGQDYHGSGSVNDVGGGVEVLETKTDFSPGTLKKTEVPSHLAIQGNGFFRVRREDEILLTRAGSFSVDGLGNLVTPQGYYLLDEDAAPIVVTGPFEVTPSGAIRQNGEITASVGLVQPQSLNELVPDGENLFRATDAADLQPLAANQRNIRAGYLELSSASPITETMELIETTRAYEANVRMIQHQDQALGMLLGRVLRSPS
jgi:flagellar basal body rod protein FlgG